jgi:hypothetical protein
MMIKVTFELFQSTKFILQNSSYGTALITSLFLSQPYSFIVMNQKKKNTLEGYFKKLLAEVFIMLSWKQLESLWGKEQKTLSPSL